MFELKKPHPFVLLYVAVCFLCLLFYAWIGISCGIVKFNTPANPQFFLFSPDTTQPFSASFTFVLAYALYILIIWALLSTALGAGIMFTMFSIPYCIYFFLIPAFVLLDSKCNFNVNKPLKNFYEAFTQQVNDAFRLSFPFILGFASVAIAILLHFLGFITLFA